MREQICIAMAQRIGQTITPDTAASIVRELFPDRTFLPEQFEPGHYSGYTFRVELVGDIEQELEPLHQAHYAETELYMAGIPLNMDYEGLKERTRAGGVLQFTSRAPDGSLAGHMRVYLSRSMHTQTLIATEDTLYVRPEHRGGFMAVRLWQYADRCGAQIGVTAMYFSSKTVNRADSLAKYLKYTHVANQYAKVTPGAQSVA